MGTQNTMPDRYRHQQWAERQLDTLIRLGVTPGDAQSAVDWVLANVPDDADPATWIPSAADLERDPIDWVFDARAAWYASNDVPVAFKRLLDAKLEG